MSAFFFQPAASAAAFPRDALPVFGRKPANLRRFHAALAKLRAGTGYRPRVVFVGDSKTVGAGVGATPTTGSNLWTDGAEKGSKVAHFVRQLIERGIPASRQSVFGFSGMPSAAAKLAYDPRLSGMSGWAAGFVGIGGAALSTSGANVLNFAPEGPIDRIEIFAGAGSVSMTYTVGVDGGAALATLSNQNATLQLKKDVVAPARGSHVVNIARSAGADIHLVGIVAQDTTVPAVDVINAGAYGTVSAYHVNPAALLAVDKSFAVLLPDLVVIQLGTNDLRTNVDIATTLANILTLVTKAKAAGADVVLEVPTFGVPAGSDTAERRAAFRQGLIDQGAAQGCLVVDHDARFVDYASANALGLFRDGTPHETQAGYADEAQALVSAIIF